MVFSSISFLFFFLPLLFLVYFLVPKKSRNLVLLCFSLFFYFFGEKWYLCLLLFVTFFNYLCAIFMDKRKKLFLIIGIVLNVGILFYYKYTNFFINSFNDIFGLKLNTLNIILPLGISFFTFQNISYLIDVYKGSVKRENSFFYYLTDRKSVV